MKGKCGAELAQGSIIEIDTRVDDHSLMIVKSLEPISISFYEDPDKEYNGSPRDLLFDEHLKPKFRVVGNTKADRRCPICNGKYKVFRRRVNLPEVEYDENGSGSETPAEFCRNEFYFHDHKTETLHKKKS